MSIIIGLHSTLMPSLSVRFELFCLSTKDSVIFQLLFALAKAPEARESRHRLNNWLEAVLMHFRALT